MDKRRCYIEPDRATILSAYHHCFECRGKIDCKFQVKEKTLICLCVEKNVMLRRRDDEYICIECFRNPGRQLEESDSTIEVLSEDEEPVIRLECPFCFSYPCAGITICCRESNAKM